MSDSSTTFATTLHRMRMIALSDGWLVRCACGFYRRAETAEQAAEVMAQHDGWPTPRWRRP